MVWENELNDRKRSILKSIIDDYIQTAQPVGSRTIARKHELGLGSATIRNEMADLEELGYITQPHTSAGRVPSDKGYRFYVDHLMQVNTLAQEEMAKIRRALYDHIDEIDLLLKKVGLIISKVTGYTSVVMSPQVTEVIIKSVQVVYVDEKRLLIIVVAMGGFVKNKLIKYYYALDDSAIEKLNNAFNKMLFGKTIDKVTTNMLEDLSRQINVPQKLISSVLDAIEDCVRKIEAAEVYMDGITNILKHPEFSNLLRAREVLELLKEEEVITTLVKRAVQKQHFDFKIGSENEIDDLKDLSVITTIYGSEEKSLGTIGVIGPTRMAYGKVVSSIKYIRDLLNMEIVRMFGDDY